MGDVDKSEQSLSYYDEQSLSYYDESKIYQMVEEIFFPHALFAATTEHNSFKIFSTDSVSVQTR